MNGLFGGSRDTWSGIAQSTIGDTLISEQIGVRGAASGAGMGFLEWMGGKLLGVSLQRVAS